MLIAHLSIDTIPSAKYLACNAISMLQHWLMLDKQNVISKM